MSCGLRLRTNTVVPGSIGGMNVAIAWPNMWLSGSRLRKRSGKNTFPYFRYLCTSCSIGTVFARMLRCVSTTPFGSAVAPEVKMISAVSAAATCTAGMGASARQSMPARRHTAAPSRPPSP